MKKYIVALLVLCLFLISTVGFAETYGEEILFRDIPWLVSMDAFVQMIEDDVYGEGGTPSYYAMFTHETLVTYLDSASDGYLNMASGVGYMYDYTLNTDALYVAGYPVSYISGCALYGVSEDDFVQKESEHSRVINAEYAFDMDAIEDKNAAYSDLLNKLNEVYGEPRNTDVSEYAEKTFWFGDNNTYVLISRTTSGDLVGHLYIEYGITNAAELIEEINNAGSISNPAGNLKGL